MVQSLLQKFGGIQQNNIYSPPSFFFLVASVACEISWAGDSETLQQQWPKLLRRQCWILHPLYCKRTSMPFPFDPAISLQGNYYQNIKGQIH